MRRAGMRRDAAATRWSTSAMLNRSAKPSGLPRLRCKAARVHCSWTNLSGSPTQRRSALPVGAVGIAATTAVGDIGPIRVGPVSVITARTAVRDVGAIHAIHAIRAIGAVRVTAGAIGPVDGVAALRAGGATLGGGDVLVSEGRVVSAHREASSERPGPALVGGWACQTRAS